MWLSKFWDPKFDQKSTIEDEEKIKACHEPLPLSLCRYQQSSVKKKRDNKKAALITAVQIRFTLFSGSIRALS